MAFSRRKFMVLGAAAAVAGAVSAGLVIQSPSHAGSAKTYSEGGIAIDGTDTVAYFKQGKPVAGSPDISHEWNGSKWLFSSEENRAAFVADPAAYAPQYGGYCAYAVSEGYTAPTVPEAWKIVDGKLYLNYSKSVQSTWEQNQSKRILDADAKWPSVLN